MPPIDETHDPQRRSWLESANAPGAEFPIQNLPFGLFRIGPDQSPRIGVGIGDRILDLAALADPAGPAPGPDAAALRSDSSRATRSVPASCACCA